MTDVQHLNRTEVLNELRSHAHPTWYQSLLEWDNAQLKALLVYYREGGKFPTEMIGRIHNTEGLGFKPRKMFGVDFGLPGGDRMVVTEITSKK